MTLNELPLSTIKLLKSTQVITSLYSIIKELVENSIDAGSSSLILKIVSKCLKIKGMILT